MRLISVLFLSLCVMSSLACESADRRSSSEKQAVASETNQQPDKQRSAAKAMPPTVAARVVSEGGGRARSDLPSSLSLASISTVYAATEAVDRKIIRNADLTLEMESPTEGLRKITAAAEAHGGFVVTSEFKQSPVAAGAKPTQSVTVVARVPASQFASALEQIRTAGERVVSEKVSGQDVSEEYLDLEARLKNKKALEGQFLEIMKQARKVEDALDVQNQLADVRTEIEQLEGRRRFIENQSALSTITTTLQMAQPIVATTTSGFGTTIKRAFGDAVDTAAAIVLFVIQAVIVLVPVAVFFGLPVWLAWRVIRRRLVLRKPEPSPIPSE